jgi:beta-lactamase regulating signal transducer with metallopeptidase domain
MTFYESLVEWAGQIWPLIANHLWQATLFFLIVLVISASLKRAPARVKYSLWLVALAKFIIPSAAVVWLIRQAGIDFNSLFTPSGKGAAAVMPITPFLSPVATSPTIHYTLQQSAPVTGPDALQVVAAVNEQSYWYAALTLVWVVGSLLLLGLWVNRRRSLSAAIRSGKIITRGREAETLSRVKSWLGLRRKLTLVVSPEINQPGVWRAFRPVIVLPEGMADRLDDDELEAVMMHELIHVERWDNLVGIPQSIACCLLWFHPLVWVLDRRLLSGREQACDDTVIRLGGDSEVYASSIRKVCRHSLGWELPGLSSAAGADLKSRIRRIVGADINRNASLLHRAAICAVAAALIFLSAAAGFINRSEPADRGGNRAVAAIDTRFVAAATREERRLVAAADVKDVASMPQQLSAQSSRDAQQRAIESSVAPVEIRERSNKIEAHEPEMISNVNRSISADTRSLLAGIPISQLVSTVRDVFIPVSATTADTAPSDLSRFVGRYEVDPAIAENFILDITLEHGALWLKPSHAPKRELVLTSETGLSDVRSDFQFTAIEDGKKRVIGLRLDSWSSDVIARKLSLPQPSTTGATTFRLRGYPNARIVALAGSFNNWNQSQLLFAREGDEWVCRVNLARGKHQYKFVIDGDWITDPGNPKVVSDERGNQNSQMTAE